MSALSQVVGKANEETYFCGYSMGCQTIVRYLESLSEEIKIGGAVFIAGFFKRLTGLEDDLDVKETDKHWLGTPVDFVKAKAHLPKSIAIFSDNDPYVSLDNQDDFRDKLGSKVIIEHNMGHFNSGYGITELPVALAAILEISEVKK